MYGGVGVDHEHVLVERRVDTDDILDLMVHLELEWAHGRIKMNLNERR